MTKKINEASIKIDVNGLESQDFETLSRMLALAGQAETQSGSIGGGGLAPLHPLDFDSIGGDEGDVVGGETQPIMDPNAAIEPSSPEGAGGLDAAIDDLAGSVSDFGADAEDDSMSLDMDGQPSIESEPEFDAGDDSADFGDEVSMDDSSTEIGDDDDFNMEHMARFAGLGESLTEDDSAAEEVVDTDEEEDDALDDAEEDAAPAVLENQLLPDLSLEENSVEGDDNKPHGPFRSEREAVENAQIQTNGAEGDNFVVVPHKNAYYWKRTVQEELQNEPDPSYYDNDGIENSRHNYSPKRNALGDNPLLNNVRESEEVDADNDDEEDVDSIYESIAAQYEKFIGGLNE